MPPDSREEQFQKEGGRGGMYSLPIRMGSAVSCGEHLPDHMLVLSCAATFKRRMSKLLTRTPSQGQLHSFFFFSYFSRALYDTTVSTWQRESRTDE